MAEEQTAEDPIKLGQHLQQEQVWLRLYDQLKSKGYLLRPRYRPGWKAPWTKDDRHLSWEESIVTIHPDLIDAKRISDGLPVILKYVPKDSPEVSIGRYLSSAGRLRDPRNHAAPLLEVLADDEARDSVIIVTPLLRELDLPPPASVRECVDFVHQTLEGLAFLHEHHVAHRDCAERNIMMDARALFPNGWHAQATFRAPDGSFSSDQSLQNPSRTAVGGVRYYFIDFGISTRGLSQTVGFDGVERAPELSTDTLYDPFKLDVYILGMMYRRFLVEKQTGTEFLNPLIESMTKSDPAERVTAAEALKRFEESTALMSQYALAQRLGSPETAPGLLKILGDTKYRFMDFWWRQTANPVALPPFL